MWRHWRPRQQLPLQPTLEPVVEVKTVAGPLLLPRQDRMITSVLSRYGVWEPAETSYLQAVLRPGQTFVDVGAHVGYFSVLAAKRVGPNGAVIAIEPEPRNLDLLRRNLLRNGCRNVRVVPFAAHSVRGWMSLALDEQNRGGHRLVPLHQAGPAVRCVRLDDLLPATVDVVKVDAQGYDHEVIAGLERTIATNPELILITELSLSELGRRGVDPEFVLAGYEALGFTLSLFDGFGRLRRTSAEMVLENEDTLARDFSVVLERTPQSSFSATDSNVRPSTAEGLEVNEVPDGLIVFQPSRNRVHRLNQSAALVFLLCTGENSAARIVGVVQEAYDLAEPPEAEVERCLDDLCGEGLVS
jgi:FkbM family methyltransferase